MSAAVNKPHRKIAAHKKAKCQPSTRAKIFPASDLAVDFARGRDHAIKMLEEARAIGDERDLWREYRKGQAQDNLVDGYLSDVIADPSLRHGFTAILSGTIQNGELNLAEVAKVTLADTQAGEVGADGTRIISDDDLTAVQAPTDEAAKGPMDEAAHILGCVIAMLDQMLQELNSGAAYGALTLLVRAEKAISDAIAGRTTHLQEESSEAMHEARDVLQLVAQKLDSRAVWGVVTLTELAKTKLDETTGCFDEAGQS